MARLRDELEVKMAERTAEVHAASDEVDALRRVATLVAQGVASVEIFSAVSDEVGRLFGSDISAIVRFERDGTAAVMGVHGGPHLPLSLQTSGFGQVPQSYCLPPQVPAVLPHSRCSTAHCQGVSSGPQRFATPPVAQLEPTGQSPHFTVPPQPSEM